VTCLPVVIFPAYIVTKRLNMPTNISFRDVQFVDQLTSVMIFVTTDIPCHLWCRLTMEKPRIHVASVNRRGVAFMSELRFCFVAYEDNEQREAGDTLLHSWLKPNWGYCVTKYSYYWGVVAGVVSPSTSPFFTHHNARTIYPPTFYLSFYEEWQYETPPAPPWYLSFTEPWGTAAPTMVLSFTETWGTIPPSLTLSFTEPWTS
jgi:hypothetical protein